MKVAVLNFSGNVGKTVVARHLLAPKLGARRVTIETINSGGEGADAEIKAAEYKALKVELMMTDAEDNIVVDIGASNVESVVAQIRLMKSANDDFDYFVLPCTSNGKQQVDTINTAMALSKLRVPSNRIKVVLNKVEDVDTMKSDFGGLVAAAQGEAAPFDLVQAPILFNEVFDRIAGDERCMQEVADDATNFKAEIAKAATRDEKVALANALVTRQLAVAAAENLEEVWTALGLAVPAEA